VRNAKYACDESGKTDKLLTLRIDPAVNGVRISVIDNGVGIAAENMQHLFTHGFTTRQSGHGFGLHSGAVTAQELGGSLHAESEGPGRGAAFILELPCMPREIARG
jgi:C4-dicarboxylate-specific signal transduction histidine kinase